MLVYHDYSQHNWEAQLKMIAVLPKLQYFHSMVIIFILFT